MVLPGQIIRERGILSPCSERTVDSGLTYGLGPAGYDLRLSLSGSKGGVPSYHSSVPAKILRPGDFMLASAFELFAMPDDVLGIVHDKSSLARKGVSVFNTVVEPGWQGFLTLEIVNHGNSWVLLTQGMGIAQVVFHQLLEPTDRPYEGKYQNQGPGAQEAR